MAALAVAAPAYATTAVESAARCLEGQPVCVSKSATDIVDGSAEQELIRRIEKAGTPIYVAVLPASAVDEANGSADQLLRDLQQATGRGGTYALIAGNHFRATSDRVPAAQIATKVAQEDRGQGAQAVLDDFVEGVADAEGGGSSGGSGGISSGALLAIIGGFFAAGFAYSTRRRNRLRQQEREQLEEVKRVARDDLVALGDDIRSLDLDVEMPDANAQAKEEYGRAVDLYTKAEEAFDAARRPQDLEPVTSTVQDGRYLVASARARLEGREPPEHRPPCFFDPRHGPSVRDVEWAPPGGTPRPVPACAADAIAVESGRDPNTREIEVGGRSVPYWNAPAYYGPWAGGFYGGFGGGSFLGGLLLGEALGGGFGWGGGLFGGDYYGGGDWGGGDVGGDVGGDIGGGDFGGDIGGGDFGGGDFGGGDF